jgi:short-subunit dehydrogenase
MVGTGNGVAVVTGASSGLGAEFARQLAARGWPVLAVARRGDRLQALAEEARTAGHAQIHALTADITAPDAALRVAEAAKAVGTVAWLVNNAGCARVGAFAGSDLSAHLDQIELNCMALVRLTAALLPEMLEQRRGIVLNVGSISGFQPTPGFAMYGATKAFVLSFSEALREELRGTGVQVSMVCTPSMNTEILNAALPPGLRRGKMLFPVEPADCARVALAQAERGRTLIAVTARERVLMAMVKLLPRAVVRRVSRRAGLWYLGLPSIDRVPAWRR